MLFEQMAAWLIYLISPQLYGFLKSAIPLSHVTKIETQLSLSDKFLTTEILENGILNKKNPTSIYVFKTLWCFESLWTNDMIISKDSRNYDGKEKWILKNPQ